MNYHPAFRFESANPPKIVLVKMIRFWIEFDSTSRKRLPPGVRLGCGVTAFDYSDALELIKEKIFRGENLPPIKKVVENIDISTLEKGHVLPNMNIPSLRGIWFPVGYD